MRTIWTDRRLERICIALVFGVVIAIIASLSSTTKMFDMLRAGDYPAFYAAGKIINEGTALSLYDRDLQFSIQNRYWFPELKNTFIAFAYPIPFALFCAPFALLSPIFSKVIFVLLLFSALGAAIYLLKDSIPILKSSPFSVCVLVFLFAPLFHGTLAGQNTAFTLLIFAIALNLAGRVDNLSRYGLGFFLSLLAYKPNFGMLAVFFLFCIRDSRALCGAGIGIFLFYISGVPFQGWDWPMFWLEGVKWFAPESFRLNQHQMISIFAGVKSFLPFIEGFFGQMFILLSAWALSGAVVLLFVARTFEKRKELTLQDKLFLLAPVTVLISPHTLYYDLGLVLFSVLRFIKLDRDLDLGFFLMAWVFCLLAVITKDYFPTSPLVLIALGSFIFVWQRTGPEVEEELES